MKFWVADTICLICVFACLTTFLLVVYYKAKDALEDYKKRKKEISDAEKRRIIFNHMMLVTSMKRGGKR